MLTTRVRQAVVSLAVLGILAGGASTALAGGQLKFHRHHRGNHVSRIPQHNGGDHDADNNGGPSDGDGNI